MRTKVVALASSTRLADLAHALHRDTAHGQRLYPVVDGERLVGVASRGALLQLASSAGPGQTLAEAVAGGAIVAHPDEPLRAVVYRMAETGHTRLPVTEGSKRLVGLVSLEDLLKARALNLDAERRRERVKAVDLFFPGRGRARSA